MSEGAAVSGFTPAQIRHAYGFDRVRLPDGTVADGTGQTIAIIDAFRDPNIAYDLQTFDYAFGLPAAQLSVVSLPNTNPPLAPVVNPAVAGGWGAETALDVEWAHAMAPGAKILLVQAPDADISSEVAAATWAATQPGVSVVSMSFGDQDVGPVPQDLAKLAYLPLNTSLFTTPAGHTGVTFVSIAGDNASVEYPATSPNVIAVGGTVLSTDTLGNRVASPGNSVGETAWSNGGGGLSAYVPEPDYQRVVQNRGLRGIPDLAYNATNFDIIDSYDDNRHNGTSWFSSYGTSAGAPQVAAMIAIANQVRASHGLPSLDGATQTLPMLYQLPAGDFNDVTSGGNSSGIMAFPGYDFATGLGTPVVDRVVSDLSGLPTGMSVSPHLVNGIMVGWSLNMTPMANSQVVLSHLQTSIGDSVQATINGQTTSFRPGSISDVTITTSSGQNTISIQAVLGGMTVNVVGGLGTADTVNVGYAGSLDTIAGYVHVSNPPSYTTLNIDDSADTGNRTVDMNYGWISGLGHGVVYYNAPDLQALNLRLGSGSNTLTVDDTPANYRVVTTVYDGPRDYVNVYRTSGPLNLVGSAASDYVNVGYNGSVQSVRAAVTVTNPPSYTSLLVDDSADAVAHTVTVTNAGITGLAPAAINYNQYDLQSLTVNAGSGGNLFILNSTASNSHGLVTRLNAGSGNNAVRMTNGPVGRLALYSGGGGTLDYSNYNADVRVKLPAGTATGVSEGVLGFNSVIGGLHNNLLVGQRGGTLIGGPGHNLLIDGNRPALTQNVSVSQARLIGGSGDNLIIGEGLSYLGYFGNLLAVDALFAEWIRTDETPAQRMAHLRYGGGLNGTAVLNSTTLYPVGGQDTVVGGTGFNWYWTDPTDAVYYPNPGDTFN